ncbi:DNA-3-methyladenine glycosylase I [Amphiplicatus metriothermophilus]|uniref:DNA-3-methyladenine glycosylase I n=1 Tax=Amphiplicatus metriothermophilus TaxID=1519374 RepID=A0A239PLF1_9PROT|nr:DNA-3-methyladenine glycosylase I [Amphiplicatus metriothermophilus]MBB5517227.1 DNA-3-methyladenine glycosylase I [Amphiplicatus metriothermophilus]SNT68437.1 DNA-3-methyladenine glycosylase I [Amphiplicatus metriothermophilus]
MTSTNELPCPWAPPGDALYRRYHDEEWGVPERDDRALFEKLVLDGFQAGLSWRTILYKRENFRRAFDGFDPEKIARYTPKKIERLLKDDGIIRSRTKIEAAVGNARAFLDVMEKRGDGFSGLLWDFVGGEPIVNRLKDYRDAPTKTPESEAMSKELKRLGFKFCGPVIVYAFMQAVGMVNDHELRCPRHKAVRKLAGAVA